VIRSRAALERVALAAVDRRPEAVQILRVSAARDTAAVGGREYGDRRGRAVQRVSRVMSASMLPEAAASTSRSSVIERPEVDAGAITSNTTPSRQAYRNSVVATGPPGAGPEDRPIAGAAESRAGSTRSRGG
jgi:hypothetical protein